MKNSQKIENLFTPNCIRTFSGIYINVFEITPSMIKIEDIAHALSLNCRWGGHIFKQFSVCQHSINCCDLASKKNKLATLLHDGSEAYLLDIPKPIKNRLEDYKKIEDNLMKVIAEKFHFEYPLCEEVKKIDGEMLIKEWNSLMLRTEKALPTYSPKKTEKMFLDKFKKLNR